MLLTPARLRSLLSGVLAPGGHVALAALIANDDFRIDGERVTLTIRIDGTDADAWEPIRREAQERLASVSGITSALVVLTAERKGQGAVAPEAASGFAALAGIRHIVAVASGKGGVGKSTTTCNLALALAGMGLKVGVLDADIYGPSMPRLFALKGQPTVKSGRILNPLEAYGCKVMSIGFVVDSEAAMIWRGPMVASAITQMLRDIDWGALDILLIDMPPGTGDAQLTLSQQGRLAGAVIVSTPQDLALIDARRGVTMFRDVGVPVLGLVENMSYFLCDACGKRHDIFAHGGARREAERLAIAFLGEVPLDMEVRRRSDDGVPVMIAAPDSAPAKAYRLIATGLRERLRGLQPAAI